MTENNKPLTRRQRRLARQAEERVLNDQATRDAVEKASQSTESRPRRTIPGSSYGSVVDLTDHSLVIPDAEYFASEQTVPTVGGSMFPLPSVEDATVQASEALKKVYGFSDEDLVHAYEEPESDPNQYYHLSNGIEAKDVAGELVYNAGTAFTYMFRSCRTDGVVKGDPESDINKAIDHLLFELERRGFERKGVAGA